MKQSAIAALRALFSIVIVAWLAYYLATHWDLFQSSLEASLAQLGALAVCVIATWVLNSVQVMLLLRLEGIRVGFWENILVQAGAQLANYIPMRIGTLLRFQYFKKLHGLEYTRFGGVAGLRIVMVMTVSGILGIAGLLGFSVFGEGVINGSLWLLFPVTVAIPLLAWYLSVRHLSLPGGVAGAFLGKFLSGFASIRANPTVAGYVLMLLLAQFAVIALRLHISFEILQVTISPWVLIMLAPTAVLFAFFTITPGNLGLREWIIGVLSVAAGYQFDSAVFAGLVDRAVLMGCTFLFGGFGLIFLMVRLRNARRLLTSER